MCLGLEQYSYYYFERNKDIPETFEPETFVFLTKDYNSNYDVCSKYLKKGEIFCVVYSGLGVYPSFSKTESSDLLNDYEYCRVEILNNIGDYSSDCIDTIVRVKDLVELTSSAYSAFEAKEFPNCLTEDFINNPYDDFSDFD